MSPIYLGHVSSAIFFSHASLSALSCPGRFVSSAFCFHGHVSYAPNSDLTCSFDLGPLFLLAFHLFCVWYLP